MAERIIATRPRVFSPFLYAVTPKIIPVGPKIIGKNNKDTVAQIIAIITSLLPGYLGVGSGGTVWI
jgi:hypothetical protein